MKRSISTLFLLWGSHCKRYWFPFPRQCLHRNFLLQMNSCICWDFVWKLSSLQLDIYQLTSEPLVFNLNLWTTLLQHQRLVQVWLLSKSQHLSFLLMLEQGLETRATHDISGVHSMLESQLSSMTLNSQKECKALTLLPNLELNRHKAIHWQEMKAFIKSTYLLSIKIHRFWNILCFDITCQKIVLVKKETQSFISSKCQCLKIVMVPNREVKTSWITDLNFKLISVIILTFHAQKNAIDRTGKFRSWILTVKTE